MNTPPIKRIAMVSVHGCPMVTPGMRFAGGMNVYLRDIAPAIAAAGVSVDVYTRSHKAGGPEVFEIGPNARVIHLSAGDPELVKSEVVPHLPEFRERMLEFVASEGLEYDLVHSHYWLSGSVAQSVAAEWGLPGVVSFHTLAAIKERESSETEPEQRKVAEEQMAHGADLVFAFTHDERRELNELFGIEDDRIHVAPGGVDLSLFRPTDKLQARERLGFNPTENIVLFVGRPEPFKGPDVLISALAHMRGKANTRLVLVGGSEGEHSFDWLRLLAVELGVADRVSWYTAVPQEQLVDFYAAADVTAVPSFHESFGLVALESMASGRPVVASNVGALSTQVLDGETGRLVAAHDPVDFAYSLDDLLGDPRLLGAMGEGAVAHARTFTWARAADQALEGYRRAAQGFAERAQVIG
ncbi:MAG: glycosyltransferase [Chloroflexi bacterium]|nr:glycosyltransferase [Chloroflexota bacterium]MDA1173114.1 glycosyltransferase [Chloroflexota bacterium]